MLKIIVTGLLISAAAALAPASATEATFKPDSEVARFVPPHKKENAALCKRGLPCMRR